MPLEAVTRLIDVLVWPITVLVVAVLLRREIAGLFGRVREIEGLGALKLSLDPNRVERIIMEGRAENVAPAAVAERIVRATTTFDKLETRILRALVDDDGRAIYNYQTDYYRRALESLRAKGYVAKVDKGFALTADGRRITAEYLRGALQQLEGPASEGGGRE